MQKTFSKNKKLGNPMAIMAASQIAQSPPKINPVVIWGAVIIGGFVVWKMSGIFGGISKVVDTAGKVVQSGGNLVSTTLNTASKGITTGASKVAEKVGLKDSANDIVVKNYIGSTSYKEAFNPNFYADVIKKLAPKAVLIYKQADAQSYAQEIYKAHGVFNDDEEKIFGVIQNMRSHAHLSQVCDIFFRTYKKGMYDYLKSFLDNNEMAQIIKMVDTLPTYRTA